LLYSPGWPQTWEPPASTSQVWGSQAWATVHSKHTSYMWVKVVVIIFILVILGFELRALHLSHLVHVPKSFLTFWIFNKNSDASIIFFHEETCLSRFLSFCHWRLSGHMKKISSCDVTVWGPFVFFVLGVWFEPRSLCMLSKCFFTGLYPQHFGVILKET
jgi:hypothetical protein